MFGLMNAWLAFPYFERAMWDGRRDLVENLLADDASEEAVENVAENDEESIVLLQYEKYIEEEIIDKIILLKSKDSASVETDRSGGTIIYGTPTRKTL